MPSDPRVAIVVSAIASFFMIFMGWNLRLRAIIVAFLGIASTTVLLAARIPLSYIIAALGFPLVASVITLVHGQLQEDIEPRKVGKFAFKLIPPMALAGGAFIIAMSVSGWNWWNNWFHLVSSNIVVSSNIASNAVSYDAASGVNNMANNSALGFFIIGLYYFLGIGLMVLEVTQSKSSEA